MSKDIAIRRTNALANKRHAYVTPELAKAMVESGVLDMLDSGIMKLRATMRQQREVTGNAEQDIRPTEFLWECITEIRRLASQGNMYVKSGKSLWGGRFVSIADLTEPLERESTLYDRSKRETTGLSLMLNVAKVKEAFDLFVAGLNGYGYEDEARMLKGRLPKLLEAALKPENAR